MKRAFSEEVPRVCDETTFWKKVFLSEYFNRDWISSSASSFAKYEQTKPFERESKRLCLNGRVDSSIDLTTTAQDYYLPESRDRHPSNSTDNYTLDKIQHISKVRMGSYNNRSESDRESSRVPECLELQVEDPPAFAPLSFAAHGGSYSTDTAALEENAFGKKERKGAACSDALSAADVVASLCSTFDKSSTGISAGCLAATATARGQVALRALLMDAQQMQQWKGSDVAAVELSIQEVLQFIL